MAACSHVRAANRAICVGGNMSDSDQLTPNERRGMTGWNELTEAAWKLGLGAILGLIGGRGNADH